MLYVQVFNKLPNEPLRENKQEKENKTLLMFQCGLYGHELKGATFR